MLLSDVSDNAFLIANSGINYYVNDGLSTNDTLTTALGSNLNSGKSPSQPMASIEAVLLAYDLNPGDVINVDAGNYLLTSNILITAADSGVHIRGASSPPIRLSIAEIHLETLVYSISRMPMELRWRTLKSEEQIYGIHAEYGADSDNLTVRNSRVVRQWTVWNFHGLGIRISQQRFCHHPRFLL